MMPPDLTYTTSATSSPSEPIVPPAGHTAMPSSSEWLETTASRLRGILAGVDTETWNPAAPDEAQAAIASVGDYCRDYCPARLACVEDACRLYRLEGRAMDLLGYRRNAATEAVGVQGAPITGLGL